MGHKEAYTMGMFTAELRNLFTDLARYYIGSTHIERGTKIKPADNTPVTDLDNFALVQLRRIISSRFPSDYTLGEEDGLNPDDIKQVLERQDELQWTVDGLDGTWHYAAGTNSYGATIARRFGNKILYAVIFRPVDAQLRHNGFFWAERGRAHGNGAATVSTITNSEPLTLANWGGWWLCLRDRPKTSSGLRFPTSAKQKPRGPAYQAVSRQQPLPAATQARSSRWTINPGTTGQAFCSLKKPAVLLPTTKVTPGRQKTAAIS